MRTLVAVAVAASFAPAAPVPKALKKSDAALIVGRWKPADSHSVWFQFDSDGRLLTWSSGAKPADATKWDYTFDTTSTPKLMHIKEVSASHAQFDCVYELEDDTLRVVLMLKPGIAVPQKAESGPDLQLLQVTRQTAEK